MIITSSLRISQGIRETHKKFETLRLLKNLMAVVIKKSGKTYTTVKEESDGVLV